MSLQASNLCVTAGATTLLDDVALSVPAGSLVAVLGPNGAGKSTLLKTLSGDLLPQRGDVSFDGQPIARLNQLEQAERRAVVTQAPMLAFDYTARDVVEMGWLDHLCERRFAHTVIRRIMIDCDVGQLADRIYGTLSGGEQQRVMFARALVQVWRADTAGAPRWLLLDEPTANLDVAHALQMLAAMQASARSGLGVLAVLHDLNLAARFADTVVLLNNGRVIASGSPQAVMQPEILSEVYRTAVHVEHHPELDRLVVLT